jgi:tRNA (guanine-N7-)-methyltransferase
VLLFESSLENFLACGWRLEDLTRDLHSSPDAQDNILTEYEINFSAKGFPIHAVTAYKK